MADMLVRLYALKSANDLLASLQQNGIVIRRALPLEKRTVVEFLAHRFPAEWQSECEVAFSRQPASCFLAVQLRHSAPQESPACGYPTEPERVVGVACYDATCRGFFGPFGVREELRGRHIGEALLLRTLAAMHEEGYGYAIIGWAGPVQFFERCVGATLIEGSEPGIYRGPLIPD